MLHMLSNNNTFEGTFEVESMTVFTRYDA